MPDLWRQDLDGWCASDTGITDIDKSFLEVQGLHNLVIIAIWRVCGVIKNHGRESALVSSAREESSRMVSSSFW